MPRLGQIIDFLRETGLAVPSTGPEADAEIRGPAPEDRAGPGDVSWLSAKRLQRAPERASAFGGTLLLGPATMAEGRARAGGWCVPCASPKLAFARVVDRFFGTMAEWPWPSGGPVADDAVVGKEVRLGPGVVLGRGVVIEDGVEIGPYTVLAHTTVGRGTRIGAHCAIGLPGFGFDRTEEGEWFRFPHIGRVLVGADVEIGSNTCIDRGALEATVIGDGVKIDNLVHVAHNVVIEANALVIAHAMLGGSAHIGAGAWVAPNVAVMNQATIGAGAVIGLGAVVVKDVAPGTTVVGNPARVLERKEKGS